MANSIEKYHSANDKIGKLIMACEEKEGAWTLSPHKVPKGQRVWEMVGNILASNVNKHFRAFFADVRRSNSDQVEVRGVILQEATHFNEAECGKTIGEIILPVRMGIDGVLSTALTARKAIGNYGKPLIIAPRFSNSRPDAASFVNAEETILRQKQIRADANRITGKIKAKIVADDFRFANMEVLEWFDELEIAAALEHEALEDSPTIGVLLDLLLHREQIVQTLNAMKVD